MSAKTSKRFYISLLVIFSVMPLVLHAQTTNYTAEVLTMGVGARPYAMGGAFVGAADDATAAYWNPAGLALIDDTEITTMHATQSDLQSYDFVNIAFKTDSLGSYALSYKQLGVGDIETTNSEGQTTGTAQYADRAEYISGGWMLGKQFAVGGSIKLLQTVADNASAFGIGSDLGILFKPIKELGIGLVARDYTGGSYVSWQNTPTDPQETLQPSLTLGFSYTQEIGKRVDDNNVPVPVSTLAVNLDVDTLYAGEALNNYHFGVEYWYKQFVALRAGFETKGL